MTKKALKYTFSVVISVVVIFCLFMYIYIKHKNSVIQDNLMSKANEIINENIVNNNIMSLNKTEEEKKSEEHQAFSIENNNNILGKIKIPKIDVEAPIEEGTTADILKESVGHFSKSNYWNGNVALASHNRGTYAHYFENINKLNLDDEIIYQTKLGTRIYTVKTIEQITEDNLSVLNDSKENTITLITCVKEDKNLRLCVKAVEKI